MLLLFSAMLNIQADVNDVRNDRVCESNSFCYDTLHKKVADFIFLNGIFWSVFW